MESQNGGNRKVWMSISNDDEEEGVTGCEAWLHFLLDYVLKTEH